MSIDPTVLDSTTVKELTNETPQGQSQSSEPAEIARTAVSPEAQEAPQGEPQVPEKFRGKPVEEIVKSYEESERRMKEATQRSKELEHQVGLYQEAFRNPQAFRPQVTEDELFAREWEQDPKAAVYNQAQRLAQKMTAMNGQTATNLFYQNARNDQNNYPEFNKLEPKMMELANRYAGLVNPQKLASPETIDLLYKLARADSIGETVNEARMQGERQEKERNRETRNAAFESPTPVSSSNISDEDKTLEQLEKEIGFVKRS